MGDTMATIIGISGSLRRNSYNTALLRAAAQLMPDDTQLQIEISVAPSGEHGQAARAADHPQNDGRSIYLEPWRDRQFYRRIK
jgi:NAD(P)H-dependent FMN reductase